MFFPLSVEGKEALELSRGVKRELNLLIQAWEGWKVEFRSGNFEAAEDRITVIKQISEGLGFKTLPELSDAVALEGLSYLPNDVERAKKALASAKRFDPDSLLAAILEYEIVRFRKGSLIETFFALLNATFLDLRANFYLASMNITTLLIFALLFSLAVYVYIAVFYPIVYIFLVVKRGSFTASSAIALVIGISVLIVSLFYTQGNLLVLAAVLGVLLYPMLPSSHRRGVYLFLTFFLLLSPFLKVRNNVARTLSSNFYETLQALENREFRGDIFVNVSDLQRVSYEDLRVLSVVADFYRRLGMWEKAYTYYTKVLEKNPNDYEALISIGTYLMLSRNYYRALEVYKRATSISPNRPEAYYNISKVYAKIHQFSEQEKFFQQARSISPDKVSEWVDSNKSVILLDKDLEIIPELKKDIIVSEILNLKWGVEIVYKSVGILLAPLFSLLVARYIFKKWDIPFDHFATKPFVDSRLEFLPLYSNIASFNYRMVFVESFILFVGIVALVQSVYLPFNYLFPVNFLEILGIVILALYVVIKVSVLIKALVFR